MPSKRIAPPTMRPRRRGRRRRIESAVTLLPQPDSPTIARVSPGATSNETPSTARTTPRACRTRCADRDREDRLDLRRRARQRRYVIGHRRCAHSRRARRGSSASRRPSPSRLIASTVSASTMPGNRMTGRRAEIGAALGHHVAPARDLRRRAGAEEATAPPRRASPRRRRRSPARAAAPACWAGCGATGSPAAACRDDARPRRRAARAR